jgi:DNA repair protein RadC
LQAFTAPGSLGDPETAGQGASMVTDDIAGLVPDDREPPDAARLAPDLKRRGTAPRSDAELLAVLLPRSGSNLAAALLERFGGLRRLLSVPATELAAVRGIGSERLSVLQALPELARRYYEQALTTGEPIRSPADTEAFLLARLRDLPHELFCCIYLDNRHRIIAFEELFRGTIDGTSVYPREVVKQALGFNAAAVILAHNHPSGVAEPSQADERITRRLKSALELVDIRLLDHLVVGDGVTTSLASRGLL